MKVPGVMAILAAPVTIQLSVLLVPDVMLVGSAVKEAIVGAEPFTMGGVVEPQPTSSTQINRIMRTCDHQRGPEKWSLPVQRDARLVGS